MEVVETEVKQAAEVVTVVEQDLLSKALTIAKTQIGVREDPPGSNKGYSVERYLESVGLGPGYSWCAAFIYWVFKKACTELGIKNPLIRTGRVIDHWNRAPTKAKISIMQARKNPELIKPGCIGIMLLDIHTGAGHMFLVEKLFGNALTTVEGNTAQATGTREGDGVYRLGRRKLTDKTIIGFLDYSLLG